MTTTPDTLDGVTDVVTATLGIEARRASLTPETELFGAMPELDSLAVIELIAALEERFDISIDGSQITAENFGSIGSLGDLVQSLRE